MPSFAIGDTVRLGGAVHGIEAEITAMHPKFPEYRLCAWLDEDTAELNEVYYNVRDLTMVKAKA